MWVKEIILCSTTKHAIVLDDSNNQWFYDRLRGENESIDHYMTNVLLEFIVSRNKVFSCDMG